MPALPPVVVPVPAAPPVVLPPVPPVVLPPVPPVVLPPVPPPVPPVVPPPLPAFVEPPVVPPVPPLAPVPPLPPFESSSSLLLEHATTTNVVARSAVPVAPSFHLRTISITSGHEACTERTRGGYASLGHLSSRPP